MSHPKDLIGFMELATDLEAARQRVLTATSIPDLVALGSEYGYEFTTSDFLQARKLLLTGRLSWIGYCQLWCNHLSLDQQLPNRLAST
jgi:hypothetical protein